MRLGLFLYDHLGGRKKLPGTRTLDLRARPRGGADHGQVHASGFEYSDCWVDDARLVVLNAVGAAEKGAEVLTRTAATSARREDGAWTVTLHDSLSGEEPGGPRPRHRQRRGALGRGRHRPRRGLQLARATCGW